MKNRLRRSLALVLAVGVVVLGTLWVTSLESNESVPPIEARSDPVAIGRCTPVDACQSGGLVEEPRSIPPVGARADAVAAEPDEPMDIWDEMDLGAILQIRRQQGGMLKGTVLDELLTQSTQNETGPGGQASHWADDEFQRALRHVAQQHKASAPVSPSTQSCESVFYGQIAGEMQGFPAGEGHDRDLVAALRDACRLLDRKANNLEEVERYGQADQLRDLSRQLRDQARRWSPAMARGPASQAVQFSLPGGEIAEQPSESAESSPLPARTARRND